MKAKDFINQNRELVQLVYGIILMVLIPLLIVLNTVFIIKKYNESLDVTLQRQAMNLGRTLELFLAEDLGNSKQLQAGVDRLAEKNRDLRDLLVLKPAGEDFQVAAARDREAVGQVLEYYYFHMAWKQPAGNGLVTDSLKLARTDKDEYLKKSIDSNKERFWLVAMPMADESGNKSALLVMKVSSQIVDELTEYNRDASVYLLIFTVLIVALFLLAVIRIWDYALLYRKIKEVDAMKDEFISVASHELRAPVTSIKGYASLILDGTFGAVKGEMRTGVERIQQSAERLGILVEDLLSVSRIEQNRLKIKPEPVKANSVISEAVEEFRHQAEQKGLMLEFKPKDKDCSMVKVDPQRLRQVLDNLIGNAIKYTKQGSVEVFAESRSREGCFLIKIKDSGIGMNARERERLFTKFYRVRNAKTQDIAGTGLGLWITKQLTEMMGGSITVDSIEGVGSQFSISFPLYDTKDN